MSTGAASSASETPSATAAFAEPRPVEVGSSAPSRRAPRSRQRRGRAAAPACACSRGRSRRPIRPRRARPGSAAISVSQSPSLTRMCALGGSAARPPPGQTRAPPRGSRASTSATSTAASLPSSSAPRARAALTLSSSPRLASRPGGAHRLPHLVGRRRADVRAQVDSRVRRRDVHGEAGGRVGEDGLNRGLPWIPGAIAATRPWRTAGRERSRESSPSALARAPSGRYFNRPNARIDTCWWPTMRMPLVEGSRTGAAWQGSAVLGSRRPALSGPVRMS